MNLILYTALFIIIMILIISFDIKHTIDNEKLSLTVRKLNLLRIMIMYPAILAIILIIIFNQIE